MPIFTVDIDVLLMYLIKYRESSDVSNKISHYYQISQVRGDMT